MPKIFDLFHTWQGKPVKTSNSKPYIHNALLQEGNSEHDINL